MMTADFDHDRFATAFCPHCGEAVVSKPAHMITNVLTDRIRGANRRVTRLEVWDSNETTPGHKEDLRKARERRDRWLAAKEWFEQLISAEATR